MESEVNNQESTEEAPTLVNCDDQSPTDIFDDQKDDSESQRQPISPSNEDTNAAPSTPQILKREKENRPSLELLRQLSNSTQQSSCPTVLSALGNDTEGATSAQQLLDFCLDLVRSYDPSRVTPATHVEEYCEQRHLDWHTKSNRHRRMHSSSTHSLISDPQSSSSVGGLSVPAHSVIVAGSASDDLSLLQRAELRYSLFIVASEVFYGMRRHRKAVKLCVLDGFMYEHRGQTVKEDADLFSVLFYLFVWGLHESVLTFTQLRHVVLLNEPTKMVLFLNFFFKIKLNNQWLNQQLSQIYDHLYVSDILLIQIKNKQRKIYRLIDYLSQKAMIDNESEDTGEDDGNHPTTKKSMIEKRLERIKQHFKPTVPKPFNITDSKPRKMPKPQIVIHLDQFKHKPVPKHTKENKLLSIEEKKKQHLKESLQNTKLKYEAIQSEPHFIERQSPKFRKTYSASEIQFGNLGRNVDNNDNDDNKTRDISKSQRSKSAHTPRKNNNKVNSTMESPRIKVRMNIASILREDALIKKQQKLEIDLIKDFEQSLHDSKEYDQWKQTELFKQQCEKQLEIEQRRLYLKNGINRVRNAHEQTIDKKIKQTMISKQIQKQKELHKKQELNQQIIKQSEKNNKMKKINQNKIIMNEKKIMKENTQLRINLLKEKQQRKQQLNEKLHKEMKEKKLLISQIKTMEKIIKIKKKQPFIFDPTEISSETKGQFLNEMSMIELQTRLKLLKKENEQYLENKKQRILTNKKNKSNLLLQKCKRLKKFRLMKSQNFNSKRENDKYNKEILMKLNTNIKNKSEIIKMKNKLNEMNIEHNQTANEYHKKRKIILNKQLKWNKQRDEFENIKWSNYFNGIDQRAKKQQNEMIEKTRFKHEILNQEYETRQRMRLEHTMIKQQLRNQYDSDLEKAKQLASKISASKKKRKSSELLNNQRWRRLSKKDISSNTMSKNNRNTEKEETPMDNGTEREKEKTVSVAERSEEMMISEEK